MFELKKSKIYTLNIQSIKVLHESDSPPAPVPSLDKQTPPLNSLSLSNGSVYNDFNAFSSKKRAREREDEIVPVAGPSSAKLPAVVPLNKKKSKKDVAAAALMDTTEWMPIYIKAQDPLRCSKCNLVYSLFNTY